MSKNGKQYGGWLTLGLAGLVYGGYQVWKKRVWRQNVDEMTATVSAFFSEIAPVETLYVEEYRSAQGCLEGGVFLADGSQYRFSFFQDQLEYQEVVDDISK